MDKQGSHFITCIFSVSSAGNLRLTVYADSTALWYRPHCSAPAVFGFLMNSAMIPATTHRTATPANTMM